MSFVLCSVKVKKLSLNSVSDTTVNPNGKRF